MQRKELSIDWLDIECTRRNFRNVLYVNMSVLCWAGLMLTDKK